ncbi:oxidoreductase [Maritimibacter sp. 55A14]|uniref:SDR family NAD(P)-dependent oxidoreductase n=1 Tax=Maritimibacter sp. 55A14 TaxID=2174844 RepID=UPI000D61CEAF|nr:SDR family oxidoreductase [Maritimibacter sp. 55A14]PWE34418.1 oxidoreductase [Maritimibacter sp. 55A14]
MTDRIALVTGASRGLGAALAEALAPTHHVIALARTTGGLEEVDDRIQAAGGAATLAPMDITNEDALAHLCRAIFDRWGRLDLLVHAAIHAAPLSPAGHVDARDWDRSIDTNLRATGRLIALAEPLLRAAPAGRAVFFADPRGGQKFFGAYGATKAAQEALVASWRAETQRTGPLVLSLAPRPMATALRARFFPGEDRAPLAAPRDEAARLLPEILVETETG